MNATNNRAIRRKQLRTGTKNRAFRTEHYEWVQKAEEKNLAELLGFYIVRIVLGMLYQMQKTLSLFFYTCPRVLPV